VIRWLLHSIREVWRSAFGITYIELASPPLPQAVKLEVDKTSPWYDDGGYGYDRKDILDEMHDARVFAPGRRRGIDYLPVVETWEREQ